MYSGDNKDLWASSLKKICDINLQQNFYTFFLMFGSVKLFRLCACTHIDTNWKEISKKANAYQTNIKTNQNFIKQILLGMRNFYPWIN